MWGSMALDGVRLFTYRTQVEAAVEEVARFHADTHALKVLTPPPVFVQIHKVQPLGEGSVSEFTMWVGPIPVRWVARHRDVDPVRGFTDEQLCGPFTSWVHQHRFERVGEDVCIVEDYVEAVYGSGLYRGLVSRLMWMGLPSMFAYRAWVLKRAMYRRARIAEGAE